MSSDRAVSLSAVRVVLLGASNLARGISSAVRAARASVGSAPLEFLIARGHGRSYGQPSRVLGRTLPGITECGLWEALGRTPVERTYALITDIGNDVAYGVDVETIAGWVEWCVERLHAVGAVIAISALPVSSIESLGPRRYHVAKAILFPGRPLALDEAKARTRALDVRVRELGARDDVRIVEQHGAWYGIDPVHIKRRDFASAWRAMTAPWCDGREPTPPGGPSHWGRLRAWRPAKWSLLGVQMVTAQPVGRLADGSVVSMY